MGINNSINNSTECIASTTQETAMIKSMRIMMDQAVWDIDFKVYVDSKWKKIMPLIRKSQVQSIKLSHTKIPDFLVQIVHIQFSSLKTIILSNNYIVSIEAISSLKAPLLQHLEINSNQIINLRSLRKLNAPNLKKLIFVLKSLKKVQNLINDASWLTELNCNENFEQLVLFAQRYGYKGLNGKFYLRAILGCSK